MLNLLIDRVGNVNIFNVLDSSLSHSKSHLKSKMDDDLIQEYIKEIENVSRISHSILSKSQISDFRPDILKDLKILGETFFDQFFPQEIVERFKTTNDKYLHFNIDTGLKDIPWELLHDGQTFLSDRFYIGKTVKGSSTPEPNPDSKKLQMLIIVDPNEDLEWAQREGELLFKILKEKIPSSVLDLHFIAGKQISKMKLLSMIRGKHIIHYSGHLYFSDDPMENGWLLANEKVLKAREIKNCGFSSNLVFSNSCHSAKSSDSGLTSSIMNYFAGSFLMSGIKCFIGTNWHVLDNENTLDFTIRFYLSLFNSKSVGEALHSAREYARRNYDSCDLTWANYTLHGLPEYVILSTKSELKKSVIDSDTIRVKYPTPIARSYINFLSREENQESFPVLLEVLISSFENLSKLVGAIVFSDHINQSLGRINKIPKVEITLSKWWDMIFSSMWDFKKLEISLVMDTFMETLSINR
jgi:hypothetical protein